MLYREEGRTNTSADKNGQRGILLPTFLIKFLAMIPFKSMCVLGSPTFNGAIIELYGRFSSEKKKKSRRFKII